MAAITAGMADVINGSDAGFRAKYDSVTIEFTGSPASGDTWSLFLDGVLLDANVDPDINLSYEVQS